jgi:hypothetical protein
MMLPVRWTGRERGAWPRTGFMRPRGIGPFAPLILTAAQRVSRI